MLRTYNEIYYNEVSHYQRIIFISSELHITKKILHHMKLTVIIARKI